LIIFIGFRFFADGPHCRHNFLVHCLEQQQPFELKICRNKQQNLHARSTNHLSDQPNYQVYRYQRVWLFGSLMSLAATLGVLAIVSLRGIEDVYFIYPIVIVSHFLMPPRRALPLSIFAIFGIIVLLSTVISPFYLVKIAILILGRSSFAFAY
jgi:hypothetical protein